jgi:hypothetical protein
MHDDAGGIMSSLAEQLGVALGVSSVERNGRSIIIAYTKQRRQRPEIRLTANVDDSSSPAIAGRRRLATRPVVILRRETGTDRFGKRLGLNREVQTGDSLFDAEVYVESDAPDDDVQATLAHAGLREHVRALLASGARVELGGDGLSAIYPYSSKFGRAEFDAAAPHLADAAKALPVFDAGNVMQRRANVGMLAAALFVPLAIIVSALLGEGWGPIHFGPKLIAVATGLVLWALVVVAIGRVVRGRSDSLRRFFTLALLLLVPVPMLTAALLFYCNGALDSSPAIDHATKIERVWFEQTKNAHRTYYVDAAGWDGNGPVKVRVPNDVATQLTVGQPIVVTTGAGRLGWEWMRGYRIE